MKGRIDLNETIHDFKKSNLVTLKGGGDDYKCSKCGISGTRPAFVDYVDVKNCAKELFYKCDGSHKADIEERYFEVVDTMPVDGASHLEIGDIVKACNPDPEYAHLSNRLWVMGEKPFIPRVGSEVVEVEIREIDGVLDFYKV